MADHRKFLVSVLLVFLALLSAVDGVAQESPLSTSLSLTGSVRPDKLVYYPDNVIGMILELANIVPDNVYTSYGFSETKFYLYQTFTSPDGKAITSEFLEAHAGRGTHVPPPDFVMVTESGGEIGYRQVDALEILPPGWTQRIEVDDVSGYYGYFKAPIFPGRYFVKTVIPMRTYPGVDYTDPHNLGKFAGLGNILWKGEVVSPDVSFAVIADRDGDGFFSPESPAQGVPADCNDNDPTVYPGAPEIPDGKDNDCDPSTPADPLTRHGTIDVRAELHTVGTGTKPPTTKTPLKDLLVRVYSKAPGSCVSRYGVSWQKYPDIWANCTGPANVVAQGPTDISGKIALPVPAGDYLVIGWYSPDGTLVGNSVGTVLLDQTVQKYLQIIRKSDGKNVPGKYTIKTGSELMIIEPEYVEWTGTQELYPFIFQSLGDWSVTTAITPPAGFVADYGTLAADVNNALSSLQFTVVDIGSDWVDTKVVHTLKHKNRTETVKSHIGVKNKQKKKKK